MRLGRINFTYSGETEDLDTNMAVMSEDEYEKTVTVTVQASVFEEVIKFIYNSRFSPNIGIRLMF